MQLILFDEYCTIISRCFILQWRQSAIGHNPTHETTVNNEKNYKPKQKLEFQRHRRTKRASRRPAPHLERPRRQHGRQRLPTRQTPVHQAHRAPRRQCRVP